MVRRQRMGRGAKLLHPSRAMVGAFTLTQHTACACLFHFRCAFHFQNLQTTFRFSLCLCQAVGLLAGRALTLPPAPFWLTGTTRTTQTHTHTHTGESRCSRWKPSVQKTNPQLGRRWGTAAAVCTREGCKQHARLPASVFVCVYVQIVTNLFFWRPVRGQRDRGGR